MEIQAWIAQPIRWLTINQWQEIDRQFSARDCWDGRAVTALLASTVVLLIGQFFCMTDFIIRFAEVRKFFSSLPYPQLYPLFYWVLATTLNYFLLPILVIRFVYREKLKTFGFVLPPGIKWLLLCIAFFLFTVPWIYAASLSPSFLKKYPFYSQAADSWLQFLIWEGAYGLQFVALEFFFRGFLLFALARSFGSQAIFIMVLPYMMIHFSKPLFEAFSSILIGILFGTLALKTRSIFGGVLIHLAMGWVWTSWPFITKGYFND